MQQIIHSHIDDIRSLLAAFTVTAVLFASGGAYYAYGEAVTLTVTVAQTLTFTTNTNQFGTLTAGSYKIATTTLSVTTNDTAGWNVTLSGDDVTSPGGNTACDLDSDASVGSLRCRWHGQVGGNRKLYRSAADRKRGYRLLLLKRTSKHGAVLSGCRFFAIARSVQLSAYLYHNRKLT